MRSYKTLTVLALAAHIISALSAPLPVQTQTPSSLQIPAPPTEKPANNPAFALYAPSVVQVLTAEQASRRPSGVRPLPKVPDSQSSHPSPPNLSASRLPPASGPPASTSYNAPASRPHGGRPFTVPASGSQKPPFTVAASGSQKPPFTVTASGSQKPPFTVPASGSQKPPFTVPASGLQKPPSTSGYRYPFSPPAQHPAVPANYHVPASLRGRPRDDPPPLTLSDAASVLSLEPSDSVSVKGRKAAPASTIERFGQRRP